MYASPRLPRDRVGVGTTVDVVEVTVLRVFVLLVAVDVGVDVVVEVVVDNRVRVRRVCGAENTMLRQAKKMKTAWSCIVVNERQELDTKSDCQKTG